MSPEVRRVAMLSAHTSPLAQPGNGDAGGMNVYVLELARRLAARSVEVEIFTRATSSDQPPVVEALPGVRVRHVPAGPFEGLGKEDLPAQMCTFVRDVLRAEATHPVGWFDAIHSHYWLSGQVGLVARDRWGVPLIHSMHTMAKVKNASLAAGDHAEPAGRVAGEQQLVDVADRLIANTADEASQMVDLYGAVASRVEVVHPGVDLERFKPCGRAAARAALGLPQDGDVILFAGRIQPLKAPDVVLEAAARLMSSGRRDRTTVVVVGGPSGSGLERPTALLDLAHGLGISDRARFVPPVAQDELALWYAAASIVCVPSYNESFGLVAVEAQACGSPVVAAKVGGLATAVHDGVTGMLVDGHDPADYAAAFAQILDQPGLHASMSGAAVRHASRFGWDATAERTLAVYADAVAEMQALPTAVGQ
ncbi:MULTISPECIES: D-inositol-3-phosphate glycosyltransferase [Mumia]|uniref:D-inositol-3-phosphate glycosyltransferase n=1 Tax=Mumia TaxID=1546255 RepID=UPI001421D47E|nr:MULTISPECIES: D-inositol-3-phosphate glycosyltransferase [unclassified Mumia]QMW68247.1 D-inositol-3-phosphate glycosyltransferase [Mumia sp. ZJ1417]